MSIFVGFIFSHENFITPRRFYHIKSNCRYRCCFYY